MWISVLLGGCATRLLAFDVTVHLVPLDEDVDFDQDGIVDEDELWIGTDPESDDSDADGLFDGEEILIGTDPTLVDSDGDALADPAELVIGADPTDPDTDAGGVWDGSEFVAGTAVDDPIDDDLVVSSGIFYGGGGCDHTPAWGGLGLAFALLLRRVRR